jgi:hypothetical protein
MIFFFRRLRTYLSINFAINFKNNNEDLYLYKKINNYYKILNKNQKNLKKKTHLILTNEIIYLIKNKKLPNFLRNLYLQSIFFIHNRFFLLIYLLIFFFDKNWKFWKKLLTENSIGNPLRFFIFAFTSGNKLFQIFHLKFFTKITDKNIKEFDVILEFGGGYGNMAQVFQKVNKNTKFIIFDLLEVNLLQYYYLRRNGFKVSINRDDGPNIILVNSLFVLKKILLKYSSKKNSLLIANWSISETPTRFRKKFMFIYDFFNYQLIAYQKKFEGIDNVSFFQKNIINNLINKNFILQKCFLIRNSFYLIIFPRS